MTTADYPEIEEKGLYSPEAAARLIRTRPSRIRYWFRESSLSDPLWLPNLSGSQDGLRLSFIDLLQVRMVELLRDGGFSLSAIRKAIEYGQDRLGEKFPLLSKKLHLELRRDKVGGLIHYETGEQLAKRMEEPPTGQLVLHSILDVKSVGVVFAAAAQLQSSVEYLEDRPRWRIAPELSRNIVADPKRSAGVPILLSHGIPISILAEQASVFADKEVADEFDVSVEDVEHAKKLTRYLSEPIPARGPRHSEAGRHAAA